MTALFAILTLILIASTLYGLFLLAFKKGKRKFGAKIMGWSFFVFFVSSGIFGMIDSNNKLEEQAIAAGFKSAAVLQEAKEYGVVDGAVWEKQKDSLIAAKLEAERLKQEEEAARIKAEANEIIRLKAEAEAAKQAEAEAAEAVKVAEKAEERRKGFHCLSGWDGSHSEFKHDLKKQMRDPDSFEHIETRVGPINDLGRHAVFMKYRARNGFGGMNVGTAIGSYSNETCKHEIAAVE